MKNSLILLLSIQIICSFSCFQNKNNSETKVFKYKKDWIEDSLGCLGYRQKIINNYLDTIREFKGLDRKTFIENFGQPNRIEYSDQNELVIYFVGCAIVPGKNGDPTIQKKEVESLIVTINKNKMIQEIDVEIP